MSRKLKFHSNQTRITCTFHEDHYTFLIIPRSTLLRMRNVSDKSYRGGKNTHFVFNNFFFEHRARYKITCQNLVDWGRPQMTITALRIECCMTKVIYTLTFTLRNTYCFFTVIMVARTRFNVTIYVYCLSCIKLHWCARAATSSVLLAWVANWRWLRIISERGRISCCAFIS
jgi:hypothetical protein